MKHYFVPLIIWTDRLEMVLVVEVPNNPKPQKENTMHYKNGRPAEIGDQIIGKDCGGNVYAGVLVSVQVGSETCNGRVLPPNLINQATYITLSESLHIDVVEFGSDSLA